MANDVRKIVIEVLNTEKTIVDKRRDKTEQEIEKEKKDKMAKAIQHQAVQTAKRLVKQAAEASISHYVRMKEDYMLENNFNALKLVGSKGLGLYSAITAGTVVGGPVGAAIGAAGWAISETISVGTRWLDTYATINEVSYNKTFNRVRAGLIDNGKGTEN